MANWVKKITKAVGSDIALGETVIEGVILQPTGMMGSAMAKSVGGLVGSAIAEKMRTRTDGSLVTDEGIAASFPGGPLVLGLTDQRVLGWSWSKLTGKPKDLLVAIAREDLAEVQVEKKTAASTFVLVFADGTAKAYEAPRVNNNPEEFVAAFRS